MGSTKCAAWAVGITMAVFGSDRVGAQSLPFAGEQVSALEQAGFKKALLEQASKQVVSIIVRRLKGDEVVSDYASALALNHAESTISILAPRQVFVDGMSQVEFVIKDNPKVYGSSVRVRAVSKRSDLLWLEVDGQLSAPHLELSQAWTDRLPQSQQVLIPGRLIPNYLSTAFNLDASRIQMFGQVGYEGSPAFTGRTFSLEKRALPDSLMGSPVLSSSGVWTGMYLGSDLGDGYVLDASELLCLLNGEEADTEGTPIALDNWIKKNARTWRSHYDRTRYQETLGVSDSHTLAVGYQDAVTLDPVSHKFLPTFYRLAELLISDALDEQGVWSEKKADEFVSQLKPHHDLNRLILAYERATYPYVAHPARWHHMLLLYRHGRRYKRCLDLEAAFNHRFPLDYQTLDIETLAEVCHHKKYTDPEFLRP